MKATMGVLLSVTKGNLMCDIGELYEFYNEYTGTSVFTHQLPRLYKQTNETIATQHTFLADIDLSLVNKDNYKVILSNLIREHGDSFDISLPLVNKHLVKEPISELVDMVGAEKVIVVETNE